MEQSDPILDALLNFSLRHPEFTSVQWYPDTREIALFDEVGKVRIEDIYEETVRIDAEHLYNEVTRLYDAQNTTG